MNRTPVVPSAPIRVLVKEYVATRDMGEIPGSPGVHYSAAQAVADEFGVSKVALKKFLSGKRHAETMPFDLADLMLCAMGDPWKWWREDELAGIYPSAADFAKADKRKQREPITSGARKKAKQAKVDGQPLPDLDLTRGRTYAPSDNAKSRGTADTAPGVTTRREP